MKTDYSLKQIDAWHDGESWYYNNTFELDVVSIEEGKEAEYLLNMMACPELYYVNQYCVDSFELCKRSNDEPMFTITPVYERCWHDIETDSMVTETELRAEFDKLKSEEDYQGVTFWQYVNNCLTRNNGTLEEV